MSAVILETTIKHISKLPDDEDLLVYVYNILVMTIIEWQPVYLYLLWGWLWQALHFDEDGAEGARGHLLHLDEEALAAPVAVVALLDLPQDGRHDEQRDEATAIQHENRHNVDVKLPKDGNISSNHPYLMWVKSKAQEMRIWMQMTVQSIVK